MDKFKDKHEITEGIKVTHSAVHCLVIHLGHDKNICNELYWIYKTYNDMGQLFESREKRKLYLAKHVLII